LSDTDNSPAGALIGMGCLLGIGYLLAGQPFLPVGLGFALHILGALGVVVILVAVFTPR
jgi:hypothetical protein